MVLIYIQLVVCRQVPQNNKDIPRVQKKDTSMFYVYAHIIQNFEIRVHRQKTDKNIELVVTFYVYAHTHFLTKRETHPKDVRTQTFAI